MTDWKKRFTKPFTSDVIPGSSVNDLRVCEYDTQLDLGLAELHAIEAVLIKALEGELDQVLKNKLLSGSWAEFVEGLDL